MKSDIEISQEATLKPIAEVAAEAGLDPVDLEPYGIHKAKIAWPRVQDLMARSAQGTKRLVLVTAITPTPAGEGKSTVSIGLGDALRRLGKKTVIALREPSLGPVFGVKGGATGGGYSQVVPMEDINLHFTGDLHAITTANNLVAAAIDNHLHQGNALGLDPRRITWKRCLDMNDRALRDLTVGLGGANDGVPREESFTITAASEIMAIFCLSSDLDDLKARVSRALVGETWQRVPVTIGQLGVAGAVAALLKDAIKPNLVQTLEGTPTLIHGGPFANIAHGCNSVIATRTALGLADWVVTEAGFGADLGAEKFLDIKCRAAGIYPSAVVLVATIRALKMHGGLAKHGLTTPDLGALDRGLANLEAHISNLRSFGLPVVVAINHFATDSDKEVALLEARCRSTGASVVQSRGWAEGGAGVLDLARAVVERARTTEPRFLYALDASLEEKFETLAQRLYGARSVTWSDTARKKLARYTRLGYSHLPVCTAKTQNSISHDKNRLGAPRDYELPVRDVRLSAGAGFVVMLCGDMVTMPGLPPHPAALDIDVDTEGRISGLF